jgi:hypothetical protein
MVARGTESDRYPDTQTFHSGFLSRFYGAPNSVRFLECTIQWIPIPILWCTECVSNASSVFLSRFYGAFKKPNRTRIRHTFNRRLMSRFSDRIRMHAATWYLTHTDTHTLSLSFSLSLSLTHTHIHTHTHTHTLSLSYTHTHTHTLSLSLSHTHTHTSMVDSSTDSNLDFRSRLVLANTHLHVLPYRSETSGIGNVQHKSHVVSALVNGLFEMMVTVDHDGLVITSTNDVFALPKSAFPSQSIHLAFARIF